MVLIIALFLQELRILIRSIISAIGGSGRLALKLWLRALL